MTGAPDGGMEGMPEPSFAVLLQLVAAPCFIHLGLVPNPATGQVEKSVEQAKWSIDLLHVLEEKSRGNLDDQERGLMDQILHQLRSAYLAERG